MDKAKVMVGIAALVTTIAEVKEGAPSSMLYMALNGKGYSLDEYQALLGFLVKAGHIKQSNHALYATLQGQALAAKLNGAIEPRV